MINVIMLVCYNRTPIWALYMEVLVLSGEWGLQATFNTKD